MNGFFGRLRGAEWCTLASILVVLLGAAAVIYPSIGGHDRVLSALPALVVAAASLIANAIAWQRNVWLSAATFGLAGVALLYAMLTVLSLPVRLSVEGTCPRTAGTCPIGYEFPITGSESFSVYAATASCVLALLLVLFGLELRHIRRSDSK